MSGDIPPALIVVATAINLVILAAIIAAAAARVRKERIRDAAWRPAPVEQFRFRPFRGGPMDFPGSVTRTMRCRYRGREVVAFEYSRPPEAPATIVAIELPAPRPMLDVRRAGPELPGRLDITIGDPAFDAAFVVESGDPAFARDVLPPATMRWLLADPRGARLPIRFEGARVFTWEGQPMADGRLAQMADYLATLVNRIPAFVWRD